MAGIIAASDASPIFELGSHKPVTKSVDASASHKPLFILHPEEGGTYPVLLFFHGFAMRNTFYTDLLYFISSHGFIVVAPQMSGELWTSFADEVDDGAKVTNWLNPGLKSTLPHDVVPDFKNLVLSGHSRGGKTAFALAIEFNKHIPQNLNLKALIGVDPVAGFSQNERCLPHVLTYNPRSLDLSIPVTVIGTGLGSKRKYEILPPCAPDKVNHKEFFNECKPPCAHFVTTKYGHMDMLDDPRGDTEKMLWQMLSWVIDKGPDPREPLRKCIGGIIVAFMKAFLDDDQADFNGIVEGTIKPPVDLSDIKYIPVDPSDIKYIDA